MTNRRNLGIDLLRAVAMFFVICQHLLGQGELVVHAEGTGKYWLLSFLQILCFCAVNIYGITTGYLLCEKKFRLSRLAKIWLTTVFWSVAVSCVFFLAVPATRTMNEAVSMFLPILRGRYWFFTAYFVVMLLSPVLNVLIRTLSQRQFRLLFAALFLIFGILPVASFGNENVLRIYSGNHFTWMMVLYLLGGYLRRFPIELKSKKALSAFLLLALAHLFYKFLTVKLGFGNWKDLFLTNCSPLILGEAVCLFLIFQTDFQKLSPTSLAGKLLNFVSPGVYAVYVIHVHPKVFWRTALINLLRPWDSLNGFSVLLLTLAASLAVFLVCVTLDALRQWLFRILRIDDAACSLSDRVEQRIRLLLER